jgi:ketosteroid isomerase-like protein
MKPHPCATALPLSLEERALARVSKDETSPASWFETALARLLTMRGGKGGTTMSNDIEELAALNRDYVASVQNCDVKRFDEILAQDFYCSNPDKSLVDRAAFLKQTAVPVTIRNLAAHDVKIRVLGDFAIIHAATSYTTADGQQAHGRYTDCWAKQNGRWLAVSAHVSR